MAGILVMIFELTVQHAYLFVGFFSLWVAPKNVIKLYYISWPMQWPHMEVQGREVDSGGHRGGGWTFGYLEYFVSK